MKSDERDGDSSENNETPREDMTFQYYMSKLKPYYMENVKLDENGEIIRSISPRDVLENYNPLPTQQLQQKINYFFMPQNNQEIHTNKYMTFND